MRHSWENRIRRAEELAHQPPSEVLKLYQDVLGVQKEIAEELGAASLSSRDPERLVTE